MSHDTHIIEKIEIMLTKYSKYYIKNRYKIVTYII